MYQAVERIRSVGDFFVARGIGPDRILLRAGIRPLREEGIEKRHALDVRWYIPAGDDATTGEVTAFRSKGPGTFSLLYRVRVATLNGGFSGNFMDGVPDPVVEHQMGRRAFHYLSGEMSSFAEANQWKQALGKRGMGYAEIIPYINGWPATDGMVQAHLKNLPDLQNYLDGTSK